MKPYFEEAGIMIYHGDYREILPQSHSFDLCLTDPPYGILSESGSAATRRSGGNLSSGKIDWDIAPVQHEIQILRNHSMRQMIWGGCHLALPPTFGYLVWDKQIDGLNFGEAEFCWTNMQFAPRVFRYRAVGIDGGKQHPTQKPVALMKWCLGFAGFAKSVIDPFMGSGSTLIAAKDLGLRAVGIEQNEAYAEMSAKRLAQGVLDFEVKL